VISAVHAHNFKGATFTAPLGARAIVVGPNGAGKSSRSQALQLAVLGYVPGAGKRNPDIMDAFFDGKGRDMRVGITLDGGMKLERRFTRSKSGAVSQELFVGGTKAKPADFARELAGVGVVDLSVFLALSDQRKVDELFRLFPPDGDVKNIGEKIAAATARANEAERKEREALSVISAIQAQKARLELPAGTLADKAAEVATVEAELKQAREDLHAARIEAARADEQAEAAKRQAAQQGSMAPTPQQAAPAAESPDAWRGQARSTIAPPPPLESYAKPAPSASDAPDVAAILERILAAMARAGCEVCAARMVIKSELAKARQGQPREVAA